MAVKKKAAKKTVKKAAAVKKKAAPKKKVTAKQASAPASRQKSITTRQTKNQIIQTIADETGMQRKDIATVFSALGGLIQRHMQRRGSGEFTIPETGVKIRRVRKPARRSRMGRNPATGESIKIAAKPASTVIKVSALKALKDTLN